MSLPIDFPAFTSGEISPNMMGRVDLARLKSSATTMRNLFVRYTGGAFSRAGTAFVGYSKQTGRNFSPRLIPFQFNNEQGLVLEFGHQYMRVIFQGAFVTDSSLTITAATQANPCVITAPSTGGNTATPNNGGVVSSYSPGEIITLAGGTFSIPAQVTVTTATLLSISPQAFTGTGYVPAEVITLAGGTSSVAATVTVSTTGVARATINNPGTGGGAGTYNVTGTTGTGTKFTANVTVASGSITSVNYIATAGSYTVNPTSLAAEPVTGGGLTGATLTLSMGPATIALTTGGTFTSLPPGGVMTQFSSSGAGSGAAFLSALFGPKTVVFSNAGSYTAFPGNPVAQAASTGSGRGVTFNVTSGAAAAYNAGDWVYITNVGGMTQLNGRTCVLGAPTGSNYPLLDVFGNNIDSTGFTAYTAGGAASRIYTLTTPWAEQDLAYLKFTESADVVSFTCVNQVTQTEYPPYDLVRASDSNFSLSALQTAPSIIAPPTIALTVTPTPNNAQAFAHYQYVATAISSLDGTESIASPVGDLPSGVDIAAYAGSITISAGTVPNAARYNFYKATPGFSYSSDNIPGPPVGAQFGYVGYSLGPQFVDTNITPDFTQLPPTHQNPFARGQILGAEPIAVGSNYTNATATITTGTGSGAVLDCVIQNGQVVGYVSRDTGQNYAATDTVTINGNGTGATATLQVGSQDGTYPGAVSYYQQRRVYANTLNNPNTYYMSGTGVYTNFDFRIPSIDTDAITGTPWAQQVNGIQFMLSMPGGLVVLTGLGAWQVTGAGGSSFNPQPITPATQIAQPQTYNGCSSTVAPIKINTDIIYVQSKGSIYRDLSYQFFTNIYTGTDLTIYASHLFFNYTIVDHAWAEEPFKIIWSVRSDGALLSLTYLREQEITGWARHDTQGWFKTICSITEPPVDAIYFGVLRALSGNYCYTIERMDNRLWTDAESTWCVDCGLSLPATHPNGQITLDYPSGIGTLTGVSGLVGGKNYSAATIGSVVDANGKGPGAGATVALTIVGGVITNVTFPVTGIGYTSPALVITDPSGLGSGASATVVMSTAATVRANANVFDVSMVGQYIRVGGGLILVTAFVAAYQVTGNVLRPVQSVEPAFSFGALLFQPGQWSIAAPTSQVTGLYHLAGMPVTGLADGIVIPTTNVSAAGVLVLPGGPASDVTIGLSFQAQLQTSRLDVGDPTTQGQRKKVAEVTVRLQNSAGVKVGANQIDGSAQSPPIIAVAWQDMEIVPDLSIPPYQNPAYTPLWTGDQRAMTASNWEKEGQIALQQDNPLPMEVLSVIPEYLPGDAPDLAAKGQSQKGAR